jgi:hypothetical protein
LPTIKNEMNLLRSRYAAAINNWIIRGRLHVLLDAHLLAID